MASIKTLPSIVNPKLMPENVKSKRQAGLFGLVASGKKKLPGLSPEEAKESLRGVKKKKLPTYKGMKVTTTKKLPNMVAQSTKKLRKLPSYA